MAYMRKKSEAGHVRMLGEGKGNGMEKPHHATLIF